MPDWKNLVRERLASLGLTTAAETDLADEIAQHLEDRYQELRRGGTSHHDAYQAVVSELADTQPLRAGLERSQLMQHAAAPAGDTRRGNLLYDLARDLRYAFRTMRKTPLFVLFVVLTLSLGIGANTIVFTLINTLILNPLPVRDSGELTAVAATDSSSTAKSGALFPISYADLKDYRDRNEVFGPLAGYTTPRLATWRANGDSQRIFVELATGNYFSALGLTPAKGRFFLPDENQVPGTHPVAVLSYGTWQANFGGAAGVIGKTLRLNSIDFTVIGVAPPRFIGVNAIFGPDLWVPAAMAEQLLPNEMKDALTDRGKPLFQAVGRLKPGVSRARAQANLAAIASALAREYAATDEGHTVSVRPIRDILFSSAMSGPAPVLMSSAILLAVVAIVLLIACSNVANLLLARAAARQQEMAVRLAMGASRRRLVRQLLTESVLLGLLSGVLGMVLGYAGLKLVFSSLPSAANFATPRIDQSVLFFALLVSLTTGFVFGLVPALRASRANPGEALKEGSRTMGSSRGKVTLANALLVGQVAFSFLLLVTAALFLRSIQRAYSIDPGFQTAHLAVFMTNPGQAGYGMPQTRAFYKDARERVARLPGVASVSWASNLPLWGRVVNGLQIEGRQQRSRSDILRTLLNTVDLDYFETAGVAIERGRDFTNMDRDRSMPVAIVNQELAREYWPGGALGKRILLPGEKHMRVVIGVARTANYTSWGEAPQPCVYVPLAQNDSDAMNMYVRSKGNPRDVVIPAQREVRAAAPQILVSGTRIGSEIVDGGLFQAKMGVALLTAFGLLALGLASIGLYGILAYSVNQRRKEIGLRMALGAAQSGVLRLILKQGMSLVATGVAIGFAASLLVGRLLSRLLYGVNAADPVSVGAAVVVLFAVALLACYLPARWASRVDPLAALREG